MRTGSLVAVAIFFAGMGIVALVAPARVLDLFGVAVTAPEGRNEVRAVYGGFGIAMASALIVALRVDAFRPGILLCLGFALVGMAFGRLCSFAIDRELGTMPALFIGVEGLLAGILFSVIPANRRGRAKVGPPVDRTGDDDA